MSKEATKYEVGQELWFEAAQRHTASRMVRIVKVGRKWLELDGGWSGMRADKETLVVDGGDYSSLKSGVDVNLQIATVRG